MKKSLNIVRPCINCNKNTKLMTSGLVPMCKECQMKSLETYIITAAQGNAKPNSNFLEGLETLSAKYNGTLEILPIAGKNIKENEIHEDLRQYLSDNQRLNKNLQVKDIVVPSQNKDPTTGKRDLVGKYNSSIIFGHSKQRYQPVPTFNSGLPRYIYTTGAVTEPRYNRDNHRGDTAHREHQLGALVVEVFNDKIYNVRNIRAMKNGKFADMGIEFNGKKTRKIKADSMVVGDTHLGVHNANAHEVMYEMIEYFNPKNIMLHDFFDGGSINYHESNDFLLRARKSAQGKLSLSEELEMGADELEMMGNSYPKSNFKLVASNHHRFLQDYINTPLRWATQDPQNAEIGSYLFNQAINLREANIDDVQALLKLGYNRYRDLPKNIDFLKYSDSLRRFGYQLASHGDKGANGSRGGNAKSRALVGGGKSISGHSHTMEIFGDTFIVGTSSELDQGYTRGSANSQIAANAILYENGQVQMLPIIDKAWKDDKYE